MDDFDWRIGVNKADAEGIAALGVEYADNAALEACLARLSGVGQAYAEDTELAKARGVLRLVRVSDPGGHPVELVVGRRLAYAPFVSPAGVSGFVTGEMGGMGFGHAVLAAADVEASRAFWIDLLGFALTDTMHFQFAPEMPSKALYFLHAGNARHHSIALIEFPVPSGLVHFMVEANDIDDVGRFIDRCERDSVVIATRLGRHSNDRMLSVYALTPGGSMVEFGCDGLQIDWRNWVPTISMVPDLWGHKPPVG
jgi:3,4-dihydroxy-9,10-secoandrosta-1,3,5(10)-triene-9,17-dione 4,5-dioxygenase